MLYYEIVLELSKVWCTINPFHLEKQIPARWGSHKKYILHVQSIVCHRNAYWNWVMSQWYIWHDTERRSRTLTTLIHLTHWGRVTRIYVNKLTSIGSDNGLSPGRRQAIIWTNAGMLLIRTLGTIFSELLNRNSHISPFTKMHLKMSSGKWRPFCLGLNVLRTQMKSNRFVKFDGTGSGMISVTTCIFQGLIRGLYIDRIHTTWFFSSCKL